MSVISDLIISMVNLCVRQLVLFICDVYSIILMIDQCGRKFCFEAYRVNARLWISHLFGSSRLSTSTGMRDFWSLTILSTYHRIRESVDITRYTEMALALVVERSCNFAIKYNPLEIYFAMSTTFFSFNRNMPLRLTCKIKILLKFGSSCIKVKGPGKIFIHSI